MNSDEKTMIEFIEKTREEFNQLSPEEVSFPRGITNLTKFMDPVRLFKKGTPIQARGAILYNDLINKKNIGHKYSRISNGEKIKYCYLKMPNPLKQNVITYIQNLPKEFGLHQYVDYDTQFEKTFLSPLRSILDIIDWKTEKMVTLDAFFS